MDSDFELNPFQRTVRDVFSFLGRLGYQLSSMGPDVIRFDSPRASVVVEHDRRAQQVDLRIGRTVPNQHADDTYSLYVILAAAGMSSEAQPRLDARSEPEMRSALESFAQLMQSHAEPWLEGSEAAFSRAYETERRLARERSERSQRNYRRARGEM